jgi:hypothetical protein
MTKPNERCPRGDTPTSSEEKNEDGKKRDEASSPEASKSAKDEPALPRRMMLGLY